MDEFFKAAEAKEPLIASAMCQDAIRALSIYGRTAGHPARLNMGGAFSYACAKAYRSPLLYKGNDLTETDLA